MRKIIEFGQVLHSTRLIHLLLCLQTILFLQSTGFLRGLLQATGAFFSPVLQVKFQASTVYKFIKQFHYSLEKRYKPPLNIGDPNIWVTGILLSLRYLGTLGPKCTNFIKCSLFGILRPLPFSLYQNIMGYPYK